jgi:large-conductance mechanosensitive channel
MSNSDILNRQVFFEKLNKFIIDNGIIGTCAGVIIALATKDLILALVSDIIIPFFIFIFLKLHIKWLTAILPSGKSSFDFTDFTKQFVTWFLTIIVTFLAIRAMFESLLGVSLDKKKDPSKEPKKESFFTL